MFQKQHLFVSVLSLVLCICNDAWEKQKQTHKQKALAKLTAGLPA
jgi:hypothetical protein